MSAFLTDAEVRRLTGTSEKAEQVAFLTREGIRHWQNIARKVIVPRSAIDGMPPTEKPAWSPDFSRV